jgi:hypothetical protein
MNHSRLIPMLILVGVVLALAAALVYFWPRLAPADPASATASVYAVGEAKSVLEPGEVEVLESEATGFVLLVETEPAGALVSVDGVARGEAPASMNLDCPPGKSLQLQTALAGYAPLSHALACRSDRMVKLRARLRKSR